jgi:hypothetical protein
MFVLTMHMPSRGGSQVHQVYANHTSATLEEFLSYMEEGDFIVIDEHYKDNSSGNNEYYSIGKTVLNTRYIGKVRVLNSRHGEDR